jgi:hypothetical protein
LEYANIADPYPIADDRSKHAACSVPYVGSMA